MSDTTSSLIDRAREVLEQRARELARPVERADGDDVLRVVEFSVGSARYAIDAREIRAVFRLSELVALPGATAPVAGITMWRGDLLLLLDIRATLGLSSTALADLKQVVVIGDERFAVGILVDALHGSAARRPTDFRLFDRESHGGFSRGIASDAVTLLDGIALAHLHGMGGPQT